MFMHFLVEVIEHYVKLNHAVFCKSIPKIYWILNSELRNIESTELFKCLQLTENSIITLLLILLKTKNSFIKFNSLLFIHISMLQECDFHSAAVAVLHS